MRTFAIALVIATALATSAVGADWQGTLDAILAAPDGATRDALLEELVEAGPPWRDVAGALRGIQFPPAEAGDHLRSAVCVDTVERPWVAVVPPEYDPAEPTPLLVALHGGVSAPEIADDPLGYVAESPFAAIARKRGWLACFPFGQEGATWWDEVGMANIRSLVRTMKREYNVDDDRVWMIGFSDGASAAFLHAMVDPNDYAGFVALNGHIGVGSLDGELPTYASNLANTPVYAVTTFEDQLYPSRVMRRTIEMARQAGGDVFYRELDGAHDFAYADEEMPRVADFIERHPRDPFPTRITWETATSAFGGCRWLAIDRVTADEPATWHDDHNVALVDARVTVGFHPEDSEAKGILVGSVVEGDYPAARMGLRAADVIIAADGQPIGDIDDLDRWKEGVERGDAFTLTVVRDGRQVALDGRIPEPSNYFVFKREAPSARALAAFAANAVDVETSRVGALRILLHPDMFRFDREIVVRVDGKTVFEKAVEPDVGYLVRNFLESRDRRLLYAGEIALDLEG